LIFKIANMWREQSVQGEVGALVFGECSSLVQHRKVNQVEAGEPGLKNSLRRNAIFHASPLASSARITIGRAGIASPRSLHLSSNWCTAILPRGSASTDYERLDVSEIVIQRTLRHANVTTTPLTTSRALLMTCAT